MAVVTVLPASAVTDREMEEARTIATKAYLRYANNGSGYLDEVNAKTMADLEKSLKAKEKENIKAFKAIKVPSDYASWDKEKLVAFWSGTALNTSGLIPEGKAARTRIRKQIGAMKISAPKATDPAPPETSGKESPDGTTTSAEGSTAVAPEAVASDTLGSFDPALQDQDILADQKALAEDAENRSLEKEENSTWVYVVILCVLIGVVIWLATYAAKIMKRQNRDDEREDAGNNPAPEMVSEISKGEREEIDETIHRLNTRLRSEQERCIEISRNAERIKLENDRLQQRYDKLLGERNQLIQQINDLKIRIEKAEAVAKVASQGETEDVRPIRKCDEVLPDLESRQEERQQKPKQPASAQTAKDILHVIYLGRTNADGIFVRADRRVSPGNTVYRLDTEDGLVGTFHVVELPVVTRMVLERPVEMLSHGCVAENLADTAGMSGIVTEDSGTAIFENGYWRVLRPSRIHYE